MFGSVETTDADVVRADNPDVLFCAILLFVLVVELRLSRDCQAGDVVLAALGRLGPSDAAEFNPSELICICLANPNTAENIQGGDFVD